MTTVTVLIGNSDDRLTQKQWSEYVSQTVSALEVSAEQFHFCGGTNSTSQYQTACWVFEMEEDMLGMLRNRLYSVKQRFDQKSIAIIVGDTEFIE